ncbi:MAG: hypothetical protein ACE5OQ_09690 [Woeseia sp.]
MPWFKRFAVLLPALMSGTNALAGEGYVIGFGGEADTSDSFSFSAVGDFGVTKKTWFSVTAAKSQAEGAVNQLDTLYGDMGLDHHFDPIGVRIGAAYWGDDELLDSVDLRGSVYIRTKTLSLSTDYEKRNFDFIFNLAPLLERRLVEFDADGYGVNFRADVGGRVSFYMRGMNYVYSVNLSALQNISDLNFLSASRLSLANSLLDYRADAGLDFSFGLRTVSIESGRRQTAIDGGRVDSVSFGFLFPASDSSDIELRLGYDDSERFGGTTVFSFFWFFYGT